MLMLKELTGSHTSLLGSQACIKANLEARIVSQANRTEQILIEFKVKIKY